MAVREQHRVVAVLPPAFPTGPFLKAWDPFALGEALEQEAHRSMQLYRCPKVDLRMDATDALELAKLLKQIPRIR